MKKKWISGWKNMPCLQQKNERKTMMRKGLYSGNIIDFMCQEKKEEDTLVLTIA